MRTVLHFHTGFGWFGRMKTRVILNFALLEALDLLEDFLFLATRPSLSQMDRYWGYAERRSAQRSFQRWQELEYVEKVRQGKQMFYRLTTRGKEVLALRRPSPALRNRSWDGKWRMVMFDFPETARKARDAFRWLLREHRMGCLQKSAWITPDPVVPHWKRLLKEVKLTEWVLLFESAELGPVEDTEIASKVWLLDELNQKYHKHLAEFRTLPGQVREARRTAPDSDLAQRVRRESQSYFDLLRHDPMLPLALVPGDFCGPKADALHAEVRRAMQMLLAS
jgi:phenylacetic acid degradation operon negative regulatory protein